jgi:hypothetical protein
VDPSLNNAGSSVNSRTIFFVDAELRERAKTNDNAFIFTLHSIILPLDARGNGQAGESGRWYRSQ